MAGVLAVRKAAAAIRAGRLVAYPTEGVWGLGCDPLEPDAVLRLLALKNRPMEQGLVLVAASRAQLEPWLGQVPSGIERRLKQDWPGPITWVLPAADWVPEWISGGRDTVAVRITAHAQTAALCRAAGRAIVSTSANRSGQAPARSGVQLRRWFGDEVDFVLGGATGGLDGPTEIRDAASGAVLRSG